MFAKAKRQGAQSKTSIAPLGGINDIDPIASMSEEYCLDLVNWFPGNSELVCREGYKEWATNLVGPVRTIVPYFALSGEQELFAASDAGIYDITVSTDAPVIVQATENGYYKTTQFGNVAVQYLVMVNGASEPGLLYNGTTWLEFDEVFLVGDAISPGLIFGTNPDNWSHVAVFKRRLWFVQKESMTAWYLPIDSVAGEALPFYLTGVFRRGGSLKYIADWSVDSGAGLENKIVFVSSQGEMAVYSGDNPDEADSWALQAVFYSAAPIGERGFAGYGGDLVMLTVGGLLPLTKVLTGEAAQTPLEEVLSKRISKTINNIVRARQYALNWEVLNLTSLQALIVIIPPSGSLPGIQFVMNSLTGAWTKFDLPVNCATIYTDEMFFGTTDGRVCMFGNNNYKDDVKLDGTGGRSVINKLASAYDYMGNPGVVKQWTLVRPYIQTSSPPSFILQLDTDFSFTPIAGNPAASPYLQDDYLWDEAVWDNARWNEENFTYTSWIGVAALGNAVSTLLKVATVDRTSLVSLQYAYVEGAMI